jgi:hypothetical protein
MDPSSETPSWHFDTTPLATSAPEADQSSYHSKNGHQKTEDRNGRIGETARRGRRGLQAIRKLGSGFWVAPAGAVASVSVKGISATSAAGGSWSATIDPASFSGTTEVKLATKGAEVNIDKLVGSAKDVRVAEITLQVMPDLAKSPSLWRDKDLTPPLPDPNEEDN